MIYPIVKHVHVILVVLSITFFQFRYWRQRFFNRQPNVLLKVAPHLIDSLLMISGISLAWIAGFSPFNHAWLGFKLLALLIYIIAGSVAMKQSGRLQWAAYILATFAVLFMLVAATTKQVWLL